ncbi:hypothetical protein LC087_16445 [Bacillus carboniphilus]|uniref:Lipoprotein n=1 Tax=Bacillus carboniphilus TaxID=86663 RepID=A0ABY9JSB2_9BACI|nr:hypothetical protein [Bacillus carboniphilus]WLR42292.1 hypothetical protein LC087_16445 [Bacillus carboniphilus]
MKKLLLLVFLLLVTLSACVSNTWVLEKDRIDEDSNVGNYVVQLQNNETDFRGYKVFTISEGRKMVVISSGSSDKTLEFSKADITENNTTISIKEINEDAKEKNSYILIGIDRIEGELIVLNESEDQFKAYE